MLEESIFAAAIKKAPAERVAFLDGVCAANPDLRANVESLLKAHEAAGGFLEPGLVAEATADMPPIAERPGTMLGPYKLLQEVGTTCFVYGICSARGTTVHRPPGTRHVRCLESQWQPSRFGVQSYDQHLE